MINSFVRAAAQTATKYRPTKKLKALWRAFIKKKPKLNRRWFNLLSMVLIAEKTFSAKRHSLIKYTEATFTIYGARSREPTAIRRSSINHLHQHTKKRPQGRFRMLVERVKRKLNRFFIQIKVNKVQLLKIIQTSSLYYRNLFNIKLLFIIVLIFFIFFLLCFSFMSCITFFK